MIYGGSANEGRMSVNMEGAERLSVTHDGKVFIGSTSSRALSGVNAQLQVEGTTYSTSSAHLIGNTGTDASTAPILFFGRSRGTSDGSSTSVASGDRLGALFFCGADGNYINTPAATIQVSVDGTPGGNDMPGSIEFRTTADGGSSTTEKMRITSRGDVGIGDTAPTTALTNFGSASRGLSIKNVQPTIALTDTDTGSGHFWIANAGGISYSGVNGNRKVTLPSVESWGTNMNIIKDPPKSIMTRKIDKVSETQRVNKMIEQSIEDRYADSVQEYPRGINPSVSVSYSNYGNNGGKLMHIGKSERVIIRKNPYF